MSARAAVALSKAARVCARAAQATCLAVSLKAVREGPEETRTHPITIARADTHRSNSWRPSRFRKGATAFSTHAARLSRDVEGGIARGRRVNTKP